MSTCQHRRCACEEFQREADEIQDLIRAARLEYTDEDWAYINRDIDAMRAEVAAAKVKSGTEEQAGGEA